MNKTIGIIGFGNMGSAIAEGIKKDYPVIVFDKDKSKTAKISGIGVARNIVDTVKAADVIILAVKPQDFDMVLNEIKSSVLDKLIISIAAGITTDYIARCLGRSRNIIRAMPNLLAMIGKGATFLYSLNTASEDIDLAKELFGQLGKIWIIEENIMPWATAISGTGPALSCYVIEMEGINYRNMPAEEKQRLISDLKEAARKVGFNIERVDALAEDIINGVIDLLNQKNLTPSQLRERITSKKGTTEAALTVLHQGGTLEDALRAAAKRAQELSRS
jgi:pyrroline-5-carboxylate reductase